MFIVYKFTKKNKNKNALRKDRYPLSKAITEAAIGVFL